jgi:outer membrane biosynthesis protein TonB
MPQYQGGQDQLLADIGKQLVYPAIAKEAKQEGRVFVKFIVAVDGSIQAVQLFQGISYKLKYPGNAGEQKVSMIIPPAAQALNEAALNAVRNLPGKWTPGRQDGKAVAVFYTVPITFSLK